MRGGGVEGVNRIIIRGTGDEKNRMVGLMERKGETKPRSGWEAGAGSWVQAAGDAEEV